MCQSGSYKGTVSNSDGSRDLNGGATYRSTGRVKEQKKNSKHQRLSIAVGSYYELQVCRHRDGKVFLRPRVKNQYDLTGVVVMGKEDRGYDPCPSRGSQKS